MKSTPASLIKRTRLYFADRAYFLQLYRLAAPIALQNLISASLSMVGSVMVGQLGDAPLAASALAGQVFFLLILVLFGIGSGSAMFTAQLWGKKDLTSLRKVLGLCLALGLAAAGLFFLAAELFPAQILEIFTEDPQVILLGSVYLKISAWSFLFFSVTSGYSAVLRSIGQVKLPMMVNVSALGLNILLNYVLIFGKLGLPALGVQGAAWGLAIARIAECLALVGLTYLKKLPIAAGLRELASFDICFAGKVFKPVLPVILNELFWSLAISAYNVVYARIGTASIDAMNIVGTVDNLAFVPFFGLSSAAAIMTGNKIGSGEQEDAYRSVGKTLSMSAAMAVLIGGAVLALRGPILGLYRVSPAVIRDARAALIVLGLFLAVRSLNIILVVGMMRSGGDTRYSLFLDGIIIWILGVPMAMLGGFILHLPVYWVYLMVMSEELTKCILGLRRYFTRKWIHNLTHAVATEPVIPPMAEQPEPDL